MTWWNLGGMNPKYKDFIEKYPDKTMIGMSWALYWRFAVLFLALEIFFFLIFGLIGMVVG